MSKPNEARTAPKLTAKMAHAYDAMIESFAVISRGHLPFIADLSGQWAEDMDQVAHSTEWVETAKMLLLQRPDHVASMPAAWRPGGKSETRLNQALFIADSYESLQKDAQRIADKVNEAATENGIELPTKVVAQDTRQVAAKVLWNSAKSDKDARTFQQVYRAQVVDGRRQVQTGKDTVFREVYDKKTSAAVDSRDHNIGQRAAAVTRAIKSLIVPGTDKPGIVLTPEAREIVAQVSMLCSEIARSDKIWTDKNVETNAIPISADSTRAYTASDAAAAFNGAWSRAAGKAPEDKAEDKAEPEAEDKAEPEAEDKAEPEAPQPKTHTAPVGGIDLEGLLADNGIDPAQKIAMMQYIIKS